MPSADSGTTMKSFMLHGERDLRTGLSSKRHAILSVINWADRRNFEPVTMVGYLK